MSLTKYITGTLFNYSFEEIRNGIQLITLLTKYVKKQQTA